MEPVITKNPSFSGWKLSFEEKKWRKFGPSYINVRYSEINYMNLDLSSLLNEENITKVAIITWI